VRIGYLGPDPRRAKEVSMIADACRGAGITVVDAASPQFTSSALRDGTVDAVLAGTAGASGTAGCAECTHAWYALYSSSADNVGRHIDSRYDGLVDAMAVAGNAGELLKSASDAEDQLWDDLPTIPLFDQPRTLAFSAGMQNGVADPDASGAGWNMDRWELTG
jgi:peptide/nickel transport system substrate-binding protein